MVYDLASFEAYFQDFKNQFGILDVIVGGYAEVIRLQNSVVKYPLLFVEMPDETRDFNREQITFKTKLVIFDKWGVNKKTTAYKTDLDACRTKLLSVLDAMQADTENIFFSPATIELSIIEREQIVSGDALFGAIADNISFISNNPCPE